MINCWAHVLIHYACISSYKFLHITEHCFRKLVHSKIKVDVLKYLKVIGVTFIIPWTRCAEKSRYFGGTLNAARHFPPFVGRGRRERPLFLHEPIGWLLESRVRQTLSRANLAAPLRMCARLELSDTNNGYPTIGNHIFPLLCVSHPDHNISRLTSAAPCTRVSADGKSQWQSSVM